MTCSSSPSLPHWCIQSYRLTFDLKSAAWSCAKYPSRAFSAHFQAALVLVEISHQQPQQCGLAHAVRADDGDPVAASMVRSSLSITADPSHSACTVPRRPAPARYSFFSCSKRYRVHAARRLDLLQLYLSIVADARVCLPRLEACRRKPADKGLQFGNLRALRACSACRRSRTWVAAVMYISFISFVQCAARRSPGPPYACTRCSEVAVMRNNDHGAVALVEHALEPADGIDV